MKLKSIHSVNMPILVNLSVALYLLTNLIFKGSHNIGAFLTILLGLGYLVYQLITKQSNWRANKTDKWLIASFVFYFFTFLLSMFISDGRGRELDNPSRAVLVLPLLLLFYQFPLRFKMLLQILPISAFIAGIVALFQRAVLHYPKAFEHQMHIQAGDIAIALGLFSLIIAFYFAIEQQRTSSILCSIAGLFGIMASLLSTARGGWVGFPLLFIFILWIYRQYISKKFLLTISSAVCVAILVALFIPQTQIQQRIDVAKQDITAYVEKNNGATSLGARFDMWKSALLMAKERPLLGWGSQGSMEQRKQQAEQHLVSPAIVIFEHAHNQYLDDLSKRGIIGLLALLAIFLVPLRYFTKYLKNSNLEIKTIALLGSLHILSVMCYCISQGFFTHNSGSIFYFLMTIVFYSLLRNRLLSQSQ